MDTPKIYVACLASYNNSILHGEWIDAAQSADEIKDEINKMLRGYPENKWRSPNQPFMVNI